MEYNNSNINQTSSGQPYVLPGLAAYKPGEKDFPAIGSEDSQKNAANSQQQVSFGGFPLENLASDNPFEFKSTAEFTPTYI